MALGLGYKGAVLGFGDEDTWGTAVTPTKFVELTSCSITKSIEQLHSGAIPDIYMDDGDFAQGGIMITASFEGEVRYEGYEVLIENAMGSVATVEKDSFVVSSANKYFDFKEDGGSALVGTVAEATYDIGTSDSVSGSLCEAIKTALEATGLGTYAVSYSSTTQLVTIAVSGAVSATQFLWKTGTHGSDNADDHIGTLLGFVDTADGSSIASNVGTVQIQPVYTHTFSLADSLPTGLTFELDQDVSASTIEGGKINQMTLSVDYNDFLKIGLEVIGEDQSYDTVTAQTLPTASLVVFHQGAVTYGGSSKNVTNFSMTLNNNLKTDRQFIGSRLVSEPQRNGKIEVTGSFNIEFDSTDEYDDFVAGTSKALTLTFTGGEVKTNFDYSIVITLPIIKLTSSVPSISNEGVIYLECPFKAYATDSSTREFSIVMENTTVTV